MTDKSLDTAIQFDNELRSIVSEVEGLVDDGEILIYGNEEAISLVKKSAGIPEDAGLTHIDGHTAVESDDVTIGVVLVNQEKDIDEIKDIIGTASDTNGE